MQFLIASTFQDSLAKLQSGEQQAAKIAAVELQMNPAHPGLQMHRLDRARDRNFWSARVNDDLRMILHRTETSLLLCYVAHHDPAYAWAERRKLSVHPTTGAAQLIVLKETVQEIIVPEYVSERVVRPDRPLPLLASATDAELLSYGVPEEWLPNVRHATEDSVLDVVDQLPEEAREAVLNLATGVWPEPSPIAAMLPPATTEAAREVAAFAHPDAQRRFRAVANVDELKAALDAPWEKWAVFLHPAQRAIVTRDFSGPARVTGSAGTGKTIVALHRAVHLAEGYPSARVLLTTFSDILVRALESKLHLLLAHRPRLGEQIEVLSFDAVAKRLYESNLVPLYGAVKMATRETVEALIRESAVAELENPWSERFLFAEWSQVVDAAQLRTWEQYRDHSRAGRRSRLREPQRQVIWRIFAHVIESLSRRREMTAPEMFMRLAKHYQEGAAAPFDFAVVDEAQDISQTELRCLASLGADRRNGLFFAGDTAQRIFQQPFSWKSCGVEVRGRSTNLKVNYRTSQEIREYADRLLDPEVADSDGNLEDRAGTVSVFNGPAPELSFFEDEGSEARYVGAWLKAKHASGIHAEEMVIFVRSEAQLKRAEIAAHESGLSFERLNHEMRSTPNTLPLCPMHLAKGLEFRAVVLMACDQDVLPDPERLAAAADETELQEVYTSERQLLYVAATRARDVLLVTSATVPSEFVEDMKVKI